MNKYSDKFYATTEQSYNVTTDSRTNKPCTASYEWFQYSSHPDLVHKCSQWNSRLHNIGKTSNSIHEEKMHSKSYRQLMQQHQQFCGAILQNSTTVLQLCSLRTLNNTILPTAYATKFPLSQSIKFLRTSKELPMPALLVLLQNCFMLQCLET